MYLNKTQLIGNLTRDPELTVTPNGVGVCKLGLATNRYYKDRDGNNQDEVEFHNLVAFGKQAEIISQYCKKGQQLFIEGRLKTSSWEKDGEKKYKTEIIVENFQFGKSEDKPQQAKPTKEKKEKEVEYPDSIDADSIPF